MTWLIEHPEFVYMASAGALALAIRWLRQLIKSESASMTRDVLSAIERRGYVTSELVNTILGDLKTDIAHIAVRLDKHLDRCETSPK